MVKKKKANCPEGFTETVSSSSSHHTIGHRNQVSPATWTVIDRLMDALPEKVRIARYSLYDK